MLTLMGESITPQPIFFEDFPAGQPFEGPPFPFEGPPFPFEGPPFEGQPFPFEGPPFEGPPFPFEGPPFPFEGPPFGWLNKHIMSQVRGQSDQ